MSCCVSLLYVQASPVKASGASLTFAFPPHQPVDPLQPASDAGSVVYQNVISSSVATGAPCSQGTGGAFGAAAKVPMRVCLPEGEEKDHIVIQNTSLPSL